MSVAVPEKLGLPPQGSLARPVVDRVFCAPQRDAAVPALNRSSMEAVATRELRGQKDFVEFMVNVDKPPPRVGLEQDEGRTLLFDREDPDQQGTDQRNTARVTAAGWTVVRIWECEIRRDVEAAAKRVAETTDTIGAELRRSATPG